MLLLFRLKEGNLILNLFLKDACQGHAQHERWQQTRSVQIRERSRRDYHFLSHAAGAGVGAGASESTGRCSAGETHGG